MIRFVLFFHSFCSLHVSKAVAPLSLSLSLYLMYSSRFFLETTDGLHPIVDFLLDYSFVLLPPVHSLFFIFLVKEKRDGEEEKKKKKEGERE